MSGYEIVTKLSTDERVQTMRTLFSFVFDAPGQTSIIRTDTEGKLPLKVLYISRAEANQLRKDIAFQLRQTNRIRRYELHDERINKHGSPNDPPAHHRSLREE